MLGDLAFKFDWLVKRHLNVRDLSYMDLHSRPCPSLTPSQRLALIELDTKLIRMDVGKLLWTLSTLKAARRSRAHCTPDEKALIGAERLKRAADVVCGADMVPIVKQLVDIVQFLEPALAPLQTC